MHTRHESLCLKEPIQLWVYLILNQTTTYCFAYRNLPLGEKGPENGKLHS